MSLITWNDTFSVGFDEIDAQHKQWIQIINDLHAVFGCGDPQELSRIKVKSLATMIDYVNYHFEFEERFMEKMHFPELETHKQMHARFAGELMKIQADMQSGFQPLNTQLMSILKNWLEEHILNEDKKIGLCGAANLMGKTL